MNEENIGVVEDAVETVEEGTTEGLAEPQQEEPAEEASESPETGNQEIPNEVWKTARVKAEKEAMAKAQTHVDEFFANLYGGYGIKTEEDYRKWMQQQETDARNARLESAGVSQEDIMQLLNGMPEVKTMRDIAAAQEAKFQEEALDFCVKQISEIDPDIKSFEDLMKAPNADAFNALVERGYSLSDAYKLANYEKLIERQATAAQQKAIKQISQNGAASPGSLTGTPEAQKVDYNNLSNEDFEKYVQKAMRGELSHN